MTLAIETLASDNSQTSFTLSEKFARPQPETPLSEEPIIRRAGERPACFKTTFQECLVILTGTFAIGMGSFLSGMITVITAPIGRDLDMTSAEVAWIGASSALTSGAFLLFFAKVADTFGRHDLLIFSMGAFIVSAVITGFATNAMYMDICNGLLGLWAAAAVPPAIGIIGAAYEEPSKRKNKAFAFFSAGNPVGFVLGCICSGVAAQIFSWKASFWLLAIMYSFLFVASIFTTPKAQTATRKLNLATLREFDLFGILLSISGIALFTASLTLAGGAPQGFKTPYVIALLIVGIALVFAFVAWEGWVKFPLMPLGIWKDRNFSLINLIVMLGFMSFSGNAFWVSLYMQDVLHYTPIGVALHLLPQAFGGMVVSIGAGFILDKINNKLLMGIGSVAYTVSSIFLATMTPESSYLKHILPWELFSVIGADLQFNIANMYVMSSLPPEKQSLAGGIFNTVIKICSAVGLGITTTIYNAQSTSTAALQTDAKPYKGAFWFGVAGAAAAVCVVPFLTLKTQGRQQSPEAEVPAMMREGNIINTSSGDQTPVSTGKEDVFAKIVSVEVKEEKM